jgi:hypothetical protein
MLNSPFSALRRLCLHPQPHLLLSARQLKLTSTRVAATDLMFDNVGGSHVVRVSAPPICADATPNIGDAERGDDDDGACMSAAMS